MRELPGGKTLCILPSCELPLATLSPDSWGEQEQHGHRRDVFWIKSFRTDAKRRLEDTILVKSPERRFSALPDKIKQGDFWHDGEKGLDRRRGILIHGSPVIEQLAYWEAAYLLALWKADIPAERPQAILEEEDGNKVSVIVRAIPGTISHGPAKELRKSIEDQGIRPEDFQFIHHEGKEPSVVDAARWEWPPYTDGTRRAIMDLLLEIEHEATHGSRLSHPS